MKTTPRPYHAQTRIDLLIYMNNDILSMKDESIIESWLTVYPDQADIQDRIEIAADDELFNDVLEKYKRIKSEKILKEKGVVI